MIAAFSLRWLPSTFPLALLINIRSLRLLLPIQESMELLTPWFISNVLACTSVALFKETIYFVYFRYSQISVL